MLNLLNLNLPVLIYFLINLIIVFFIHSYFDKYKSLKIKSIIFRLLIIIIIFTLLLQLLYNKNFRITVWLLVLSPIILIILLFFFYIFIIIRFKGKFEIKSLISTFKMIKTILSFKINSNKIFRLNI